MKVAAPNQAGGERLLRSKLREARDSPVLARFDTVASASAATVLIKKLEYII